MGDNKLRKKKFKKIKEKGKGKDHRKRPPSVCFLERQRAMEATLWSDDDQSSQEKVPASSGWAARWRHPGLGRTSGLKQTANPDGMLLVWRCRHGALRSTADAATRPLLVSAFFGLPNPMSWAEKTTSTCVQKRGSATRIRSSGRRYPRSRMAKDDEQTWWRGRQL